MKNSKQRWIIGWVVFIGLFGLDVIPQEAQHSPYYYQKKSLFELLPNQAHEIIFLGDSITDGCEWAELFCNKKIINRGISGDTTDGVLARLGEVLESSPKAVFMMIGVNDLGGGKSVEYILDNLGKIIKKIKKISPGTKLYVQSILPVSDKFNQFPTYTDKNKEIISVNRTLESICRKTDTVYIDLHSLFAGENGKLDPAYTNEGLHINGKGYLLWKSVIQKFVNPKS